MHALYDRWLQIQKQYKMKTSLCHYHVIYGFLQKQEKLKQNENIMINNEEIKNKLEMILGMHSRANINLEDYMYIIKQCNNILTTLGKKTSNLEFTRKRKIELQARFVLKKKYQINIYQLHHQLRVHKLESLKNSTEFLTISTTPAFDYS